MARGQHHLFSYLFALFVAVLVLMFGYKAIFGVSDQIEQEKYALFRVTLENDISTISVKFGDMKHATYEVPRSVSEVCFYAPSDSSTDVDDSCKTLSDYPLVEDSVSAGAGKNVFVLGNKLDAFKVPYADTGICALRCFEAEKGHVSLLLRGASNATLISA